MITDHDFKKLKKQIEELFHAEFKVLRKELKNILKGSESNYAELKAIRQGQKEMLAIIANKTDIKDLRKAIDEYISIMKDFAREQKILIRKMQEIEDYFDPKIRN